MDEDTQRAGPSSRRSKEDASSDSHAYEGGGKRSSRSRHNRSNRQGPAWGGFFPGSADIPMGYGFDPAYGPFMGDEGNGYWDPTTMGAFPFGAPDAMQTGPDYLDTNRGSQRHARRPDRSDSGWPDRGKEKRKTREERTGESARSRDRSHDEDEATRERRAERLKRRRRSAGLDSDEEERVKRRSDKDARPFRRERSPRRNPREQSPRTRSPGDRSARGRSPSSPERKGSDDARKGERWRRRDTSHDAKRERRGSGNERREERPTKSKDDEPVEREKTSNYTSRRHDSGLRSDTRAGTVGERKRSNDGKREDGMRKWGARENTDRDRGTDRSERRDNTDRNGRDKNSRGSAGESPPREERRSSNIPKRDNGWNRRRADGPGDSVHQSARGEDRGERESRDRSDERWKRDAGHYHRSKERGSQDKERDSLTPRRPSTPPRRRSPEAQILRRRPSMQGWEKRQDPDRAREPIPRPSASDRSRPRVSGDDNILHRSDSDKPTRAAPTSRWVKVARRDDKMAVQRADDGPSDAMQAAMEAALTLPVHAAESSTQRQEVRLPLLVRARPDEVYEQVAQVGEGTYGQVFKAKADKTGVIVALKKIRMESEKDGFPITAMREIKLLQGLRHDNIVRLHEMMLSKNSIYMVFEYLEHDLNGILAQPSIQFEPAHIKSLALQLLSGLAYLHHHSILHRDLKGSNLLIDSEGTLKIADFGLARRYTKQTMASVDYTNRVVTLWYRPPELLFGETCYKDAVDVWGAGCIFIELFTRRPFIQGQDEIHQVQLLLDTLGPIDKHDWPDVDTLPWYDLVRPAEKAADDNLPVEAPPPSRIHQLFANQIPNDALDVAAAILVYNPAHRSSAANAMQMDYFASNRPRPEKPWAILQNVMGEWHEFESRQAKRMQQQQQQQQKPKTVVVAHRNGAAASEVLANDGQMGPPEMIHC